MSGILQGLVRRLRRDQRGTMVIETALVAPVLILMSLGGVEIANIVMRQHQLQSAVSKASEIVMAAYPDGPAETNNLISQLATFLEDDTGLTTTVVAAGADPDETKKNVGYVMRRFRCGNSQSFKKTNTGGCTDSSNAREFIVFILRDEYTPVWTNLGIGSELQYSVEKSVQIG